MDNNNLDQLLEDRFNRTFWLKPVGVPGVRVDRNQIFTNEKVRVDFAGRQPPRIPVGDIFIVYRIRACNIIYIAECLDAVWEATPDEIDREPFRERWRWYYPARNLTPKFGRAWNRYRLQPFRIADEFHGLMNFTLYGVQHGRGAVPVPLPVANLVIQRIRNLPCLGEPVAV